MNKAKIVKQDKKDVSICFKHLLDFHHHQSHDNDSYLIIPLRNIKIYGYKLFNYVPESLQQSTTGISELMVIIPATTQRTLLIDEQRKAFRAWYKLTKRVDSVENEMFNFYMKKLSQFFVK